LGAADAAGQLTTQLPPPRSGSYPSSSRAPNFRYDVLMR
jgi:hypothetical protein